MVPSQENMGTFGAYAWVWPQADLDRSHAKFMSYSCNAYILYAYKMIIYICIVCLFLRVRLSVVCARLLGGICERILGSVLPGHCGLALFPFTLSPTNMAPDRKSLQQKTALSGTVPQVPVGGRVIHVKPGCPFLPFRLVPIRFLRSPKKGACILCCASKKPSSRLKVSQCLVSFGHASLSLSLSRCVQRVLTQQGNEKGAHRCSGAPTTY